MPHKPAAALVVSASLLPLLAWGLGWTWYLDGPLVLLVAVIAGYAAGAWLPRVPAVAAVVVSVTVLVLVNQWHDRAYHWLDDTVFFTVIVGGAAGAGAAVRLRAAQVRRLQRLAAELDEQQRVDVAAARLEEQNRVQQEVHARLAERIAAIAVRAEGAQRTLDPDAFEVLESEARSVLDQLRAALGSLATPDPSPRPPAPATPAAPRPSPLDLALAGALAVALSIETVVHPLSRGPVWANVLASAAVATPLVFRRGHPFPALGASLLAAMLMSAWLTPIPATVTGVALLVIVFYTVGAWCRGWWWVLGWLLAAGATVLLEEVSGLADDGVDGDAGWIVLVWTVAAVVLGRLGAGWQERVHRTADLVAELERGRGSATRLATAQEREALASGLHDTVAHAMTVVCVQAGAQRRSHGDAQRDARNHRHDGGRERGRAPRRPGRDRDHGPAVGAVAAGRRRPPGRRRRGSLRAGGGADRPRRLARLPRGPGGDRQRRPALPRRRGRGDGDPTRELAAGRGPRPRQRRCSRGLGLGHRAGRTGEDGRRGRRHPRLGSAHRGRLRRGRRDPRRRTPMTTIVLADDQELVRAGLRMILTAEPDLLVLGEAADGAAAVDLAHSIRPDVVLMDIRMPGLDGIEATRRITGSLDAVRVVMLTTFDRSQLVYDSLLAGASGFLLKDAPSEQLVSGIRAVVRGEELLAPRITRRLIEEFTRAGRQGPPPGYDRLTEREVEVFELVARGRSNAEIAGELFLSIQTVKTHVARVLAKLGVRDRVQAVVLAYESGLVRPGE